MWMEWRRRCRLSDSYLEVTFRSFDHLAGSGAAQRNWISIDIEHTRARAVTVTHHCDTGDRCDKTLREKKEMLRLR